MQDTDATFRGFVLHRSTELLRTAWMLTGDRALAEDLLQTALAKTWPQWDRVSRHGPPTSYVRTVMVRTFASWAGRRWCAELPTERLPERVTEEAGFTAADDQDLLLRALSRLPRRQRAVIVLRYYLDCSESQAADLLGCSVGTVKTQGSRGLARLRQLLADPSDCEREQSQ